VGWRRRKQAATNTTHHKQASLDFCELHSTKEHMDYLCHVLFDDLLCRGLFCGLACRGGGEVDSLGKSACHHDISQTPSHIRTLHMATQHSAIMARFQSSRRRAAAPLGSLLLVLLGTASVSAFLFPAAPRACRTTPSPLTTATTTTTTRLFSSAVDEAHAQPAQPAQQQEQPEAQEQQQEQQQQQQPARRRPNSPRPSGPWVLLEGKQGGREGGKEEREGRERPVDGWGDMIKTREILLL